MNDKIITLTDDNFDEVVTKSDTPVLIDFWAEWCGPCKILGPILDDIVQEYDGKLTIGKINVDDSNELAAKYGVRGIPTLIIFKGDSPVSTKVGALSKADLRKFIDEQL